MAKDASKRARGKKPPQAAGKSAVRKTARGPAAKAVADLARFPSENPNPVMRISKDGTLLYANRAARPLIAEWKAVTGGPVPAEWKRRVRKSLARGKPGEESFDLCDRIFALFFVPIAKAGYVNLYGRDVTERRRAQNALRESREDLNRAQAVAHTGSWRLDVHRDVLLWSEETHRIFGVPPGTPMTYETFLAVVHPEDRELVNRAWQTALEGKPYDVEHRAIVNGKVKWVRERAELEFDAGNVLRGGFGTTQDITELKAVQHDLRDARDKLEVRVRARTAELEQAVDLVRDQGSVLEAFFRHSLTPLVFLDRRFNFVRVNEAYAKSCGRAAPEFLGHNHFEFYPDAENQAIFRQVVDTKTPYVATAKPFRFPDHPEWGESYWDWTLTPILDERGKVEFLVFSLEDVTKAVRARQALEESEARYRALIEEASEGILIIDAEGRILEANPSAERVLSREESSLIGRGLQEFLAPDEASRRPLPLAEVNTGRTVTEERRLHRPDGSVSEVETTAKRLADGRILVIGRDITARRRAQETLRAYQSRLKSMATELSLVEDRQRRALARDLHDLIGQALAVAKIKLGTLRNELSGAHAAALGEISDLISRTIQDTRTLTFDLCPPVLTDLGIEPALEYLVEEFGRQRGITARFAGDGTPKPLEDNVRAILFRAVRELLHNVSKHSGARHVSVSVARREGAVEIVVEDDGAGFDADALRLGMHPGGGFGLFSIREQMGYLGGFFNIESRPGKGTRAVLTAGVKPDHGAVQEK